MMKLILAFALLILTLTACTATVVPVPAPYAVTARFSGGSATWIERMPCAAPTCAVEHGRVTSTDVAEDGGFMCNARIDDGQTLVMTLACSH